MADAEQVTSQTPANLRISEKGEKFITLFKTFSAMMILRPFAEYVAFLRQMVSQLEKNMKEVFVAPELEDGYLLAGVDEVDKLFLSIANELLIPAKHADFRAEDSRDSDGYPLDEVDKAKQSSVNAK